MYIILCVLLGTAAAYLLIGIGFALAIVAVEVGGKDKVLLNLWPNIILGFSAMVIIWPLGFKHEWQGGD